MAGARKSGGGAKSTPSAGVGVAPRIFISYRRDDSEGHTGRLADALIARFGEEQVFRDLDTIPLGVDFTVAITEAVSSCDVLIAVIGRDWLKLKDSGGRRRLDDPGDFVRVEIQAALERDIRVIPAIVANGRLPTAAQLPEDLVRLARRNAIVLHSDSWRSGVERLIAAVEEIGREKAEREGDEPRSAEGKRQEPDHEQAEQASGPPRRRSTPAARKVSRRASAPKTPPPSAPDAKLELPLRPALFSSEDLARELAGDAALVREELVALPTLLGHLEGVLELAHVSDPFAEASCLLVMTTQRLLLFEKDFCVFAEPLSDVSAINWAGSPNWVGSARAFEPFMRGGGGFQVAIGKELPRILNVSPASRRAIDRMRIRLATRQAASE